MRNRNWLFVDTSSWNPNLFDEVFTRQSSVLTIDGYELLPTRLITGQTRSTEGDLIQQFIGKTVIIKDIHDLRLPTMKMEETASILRGLYDGLVTKEYGNGVSKRFLGRAFLIFIGTHLPKELQIGLGTRILTLTPSA